MVFRQALIFRALIALSFSLVWGSLLGFIAAFQLGRLTQSGLLQCLGVAWAAVFVGVFLYVRQTRLVVTTNGIEYFSELYHLRSTWENISHVAKVRVRSPPCDGLILKEPGIFVSNKLWFAQVALLKLTIPELTRSIPLGSFVGDDWRTTCLGREILNHAPQLKS